MVGGVVTACWRLGYFIFLICPSFFEGILSHLLPKIKEVAKLGGTVLLVTLLP